MNEEELHKLRHDVNELGEIIEAFLDHYNMEALRDVRGNWSIHKTSYGKTMDSASRLMRML